MTQCAQLAGTLADYASGFAPEGARLLLEGGSMAALNEREVLDVINGSVRQIREKIFGRPEARFTPDQYPEAIAWLEAEKERTFRRLTPNESARVHEIREEVASLMEERRQIERHHWTSGTRWPGVRYFRPRDGTSPRLRVRVDSPLYPLVDGAARIAEVTGIPKPAIVAYILADIPPWVPRVSITDSEQGRTLPDGRYARRETITITLNDFFLSESEIRWILQQVREQRGKTTENAALRSILRRLGGVPEKAPKGAKDAFWKKVLEEWVDVGLSADGKDPAGALRKRFSRLSEADKQALWLQHKRRAGPEREPSENDPIRLQAL